MTLVSGLIAAAAFAVGALLGSYAVTAGVRWARAESSVRGRSHCDACAVRLGFLHTIPIFAFMTFRGACRSCKAKIDIVHLVGELAGGVVVASVVIWDPTLRGALLAALGLLLITSATVDAKTRQLPDLITWVVAILGIAASALSGPMHVVAGVLAAIIAAGVLWLLRQAGIRRGRDPGLGFGDVKLIVALALWLGAATPWMVVAAATLGLAAMALVRPSDGRLPFGPLIAAAAWTVGISVEGGGLRWLI